MKQKPLAQAKDRDLVNSFAAMRRASQAAREQAVRAWIGIVVIRDGKLTRVAADELRSEMSTRRR